MDALTALAAIQAILTACDDKTRQRVLKELAIPEKAAKKPKRRRLVTLLEAREHLIRIHFKQ